jgi:hypothetical protein
MHNSPRPAELFCTFVLFADVEAIALFAATAIRTGLPAFGADDAAIVIDRDAELRASRRAREAALLGTRGVYTQRG